MCDETVDLQCTCVHHVFMRRVGVVRLAGERERGSHETAAASLARVRERRPIDLRSGRLCRQATPALRRHQRN